MTSQKSPAKILRSIKRITYFIRNKWKTISSLCLEPICSHIQPFLHQAAKTPIAEAQTASSQPKTFRNENLMMILKQYEADNKIEHEERKRQREKDLESFQLELKSEIDKIMLKFAKPP